MSLLGPRYCLGFLLLWLIGGFSWAAVPVRGMEARLQALTVAVESQVAASAGALAPAEWRKVLWFYLAGNQQPAALVVLRTRRDECAAVAMGAQPCRALIFAGKVDGSFKLVSEFTLRVQPVALVHSAGGVKELLYSRDTGANPIFARYLFDGEAFSRADGEVTGEELQRLSLLLADDRNMPLMADQVYAARQFMNNGARLAPFRLHFDAVAFSALRKRDLYGTDYDARTKQLLEAIQPDAQVWVAALPWPQTMELRLWSCVDWMVERRFWEVEDRRLGRLGTCVEPALFAARQGLVRGDDALADLVRVPLLSQVGAAWLLRVAPLSPSVRAQLRRPDEPGDIQFLGALSGQWLANQRRQLSLDRMAEALSTLAKTSDHWFSVFELGQRRYVARTPELRAFDASLAQYMRAHQCLRKLLNKPPAKVLQRIVCDDAALEVARPIANLLQKDLES